MVERIERETEGGLNTMPKVVLARVFHSKHIYIVFLFRLMPVQILYIYIFVSLCSLEGIYDDWCLLSNRLEFCNLKEIPTSSTGFPF